MQKTFKTPCLRNLFSNILSNKKSSIPGQSLTVIKKFNKLTVIKKFTTIKFRNVSYWNQNKSESRVFFVSDLKSRTITLKNIS